MTCRKCNGTKHVVRDGKLVRCECIRAHIRAMAYRRAGVPQTMWAVPLAELKAGSLLAGRSLEAPPPPGRCSLVWVRARAAGRARQCTLAYILRRCVNAGADARRVKLSALIDAAFDREDRAAHAAEIATAACLVLELDLKNGHKLAPQTFADVWAARSSMFALTVFVSEDSIADRPAMYGADLAAVFGSPRRHGILVLEEPFASRRKAKP